jgi:hypothetical protein
MWDILKIGEKTMRPGSINSRVSALLLVLALPCGGALAASLSGTTSTSPLDATPSSSFDGTYRGSAALIETSISRCDPGAAIDVAVKNNKFDFTWKPGETAIIHIGSDGRISAMLQGTFASADKHMQVLPRIDGYTDGHVLAGEYGTRWCKYKFQLDRV